MGGGKRGAAGRSAGQTALLRRAVALETQTVLADWKKFPSQYFLRIHLSFFSFISVHQWFPGLVFISFLISAD